MTVIRFAAACLAVPCTGSYIVTPNGLWPEECVHRVPTGTHVRETADGVHYRYPNGTESRRGNCTSGIPPTPQRSVGNSSKGQLQLVGSGHDYPLSIWAYGQEELQSFTANYNVPRSPARDAGQTVFWWFGAQDGNPAVVIQPVLGYSNGGWTFSSWNCCPNGHQHQADNVIQVSPGDTLTAKVERSGNGFSIVSEARGQSSILQANDGINFKDVLLSLETYNVNQQADLLPQGCMRISNMRSSPQLPGWNPNEPYGWGMSAVGWTISNTGNDLETCPPGSPSPSSIVV